MNTTTTTTTDTLDPTVRTLLYDIQRVSDALRILKQKCGEGNTSVNSRALGSPLGGLDSYSLREILDRLFGESDGGSSLTNWADACDHAPFKLYKSYRENIVEVGISIKTRTLSPGHGVHCSLLCATLSLHFPS